MPILSEQYKKNLLCREEHRQLVGTMKLIYGISFSKLKRINFYAFG
jgi:hypothetical protein